MPRVRMIIGFYFCIKIMIPNIILNPWKYKKNLEKDPILQKFLFLILHNLFIDLIDTSLKKTEVSNEKFKSYYRYKFITKPLDPSIHIFLYNSLILYRCGI